MGLAVPGEGWRPRTPHGRERFCPTLRLCVPTRMANPAVESPSRAGEIPVLPLPTATPRGRSPSAIGEVLAAIKNQPNLWMFWMELLPHKEQKAGGVRPGSQRGVCDPSASAGSCLALGSESMR